MIPLAEILYLTFSISFAYLNYLWIKKDLRIYHFWNALAHLIAWALLYLLVKDWKILFVLPFIGRTAFDFALNKFRGLSLGYVGNGSSLDRIEIQLFDNPLMAKVVYITFIIAFNVVLICQ